MSMVSSKRKEEKEYWEKVLYILTRDKKVRKIIKRYAEEEKD